MRTSKRTESMAGCFVKVIHLGWWALEKTRLQQIELFFSIRKRHDIIFLLKNICGDKSHANIETYGVNGRFLFQSRKNTSTANLIGFTPDFDLILYSETWQVVTSEADTLR